MRVITDDGQTIELGTVEDAPTIGITDYSRRVTDDFGVTTVVERGFSRTLSVRLGVGFGLVDTLQRQLANLRATPALWVADDTHASMSVRGFYKDFDLDLATAPLSYCTLTVEGLAETATAADPGGDPAPTDQVSTLQLLQPTIMTDSVLVASSVPENDAPEWAVAGSYAVGAKVIRTATQRVYESLVAANVGHDPAASPAQWLDLGPTNRWAMFDQALGTATTGTGSIAVTLNAGVVGGVALLDLVGASVRVQATGYDRTQAVGMGTMSFLDLPANAGRITVTVTGPATVAVGTLLIGPIVALGITEASPTAGITDYSRKDVDDFGEVTIVQRAWSKRMTAKALIRSDALDIVMNRIAAVRARPSLWIGQTGLDSLTIYGFFKDFSIEVGDQLSKLSLSIEGLSKAATLEPLITVDWADLTDTTGTKPADNATVGATVGTNVKLPDGSIASAAQILNPIITLQPDGTLIATIAGVPSVLGKVALPDLGAATDASRRQLESDLASLSAAVAQLTAGQALVQNVFRDAGLYTDPSSGIAKLYAVESRAEQITNLSVALNAQLATISLKADVSYVKNAIALAQLPGQTVDLSSILVRLTSAETNINGLSATVQLKADATVVTGLQGTVGAVQQSLNALTATVATKASQTIVDAQGARLTLAEQTLSAMDGASIAQSVTASRRAVTDADAIGATTILDLLNSAQNAQAAQDGIASARQELGARVSSAFDAVATLTTNLAVQIGAVNAAAAIESAARISADQASASTLATYQATVAANFASANTAIGVVSTKADATAQALTDFKVQTASNLATLTTQQTAQAGATSAIAQSLTDFKAATATNLAAIDVRFTAASDATKAVAQQVADLTASTNTALGSVNTKVSAAATKADATAQSLADYQTSTNANLGSISQKLSTTTDQTQGLASAVTTLTAGANVRQNLQLNGGFENGTTGLTASQAVAIADDPFGGRLLHWEYNDTTVVLMPAVNVVPGEPYTIGFDANVRVGSGALRVDASTFSGQNGTGQVTYDRYSSAGFGDGTMPDVRRSFTFTAPAGCASIQLRLISYGIANPGSIWIRRIKVEHGAAPATAYSADTTIADTASGASAANASFTQLASVVAGNAQAVAGQITTINTTLNGQSNTLTQYGQSINGLSSKWGVEFNANGAISGFALNNGSGRTDATFVVDNFRIVQANGGNNRQVFSIAADGTIQMPSVRIDTLAAGAVTYDGMQMGAAQKCAFQSTSGDFAIGQNQTANVVSVTFVKEDASSVLKLVMFANCYSPDDLQFVGTILLDGNSVQSARVNIVLDTQTSQGEMPVTPFMFLSGVGAGQHTVAFTIQNTNVKNLNLTVRGGATLEVTELRKGSIGSSTGSGSSIVSSGSSSGGGSSGGGGSGGGYSGGNVKQQ